jgi:SWI/SNF-related matrix-associated actin-dependent regulator of chromatin subfamily A3
MAAIDDSALTCLDLTRIPSLEGMMEKHGIGCARLDGTMKREDRTEAMERLKSDAKCEVLLVSLRAGGVGLNLVAASRCYLIDPYW